MCFHFGGQCVLCWFHPSWRDDYGQDTTGARWISPSSLRTYCGFSKLHRVLRCSTEDVDFLRESFDTVAGDVELWLESSKTELLNNQLKVLPTSELLYKVQVHLDLLLTMFHQGASNKKNQEFGRDGIYILSQNLFSSNFNQTLGEMEFIFCLWIFVFKFKAEQRGARWNIYHLWAGPEPEEQNPWVWHIWIVIVRLRDFICPKFFVLFYHYFTISRIRMQICLPSADGGLLNKKLVFMKTRWRLRRALVFINRMITGLPHWELNSNHQPMRQCHHH